MKPNPVLKKLGYANTDRLVILHADDVGMCQATIPAFIDLWESGGISSGAIMMPCPWAKAAAEYCRTHPGVDLGVHATLNAEWNTYRWGALSTVDPGTGLLDGDGFLWQSTAETQEHADPEAVLVELQTQVQQALAWGVDATHLDTHMGTVAHPRLVPAYLQAAMAARLAVMIPRDDPSILMHMGEDPESAAGFIAFTSELAAGFSAFTAQLEAQGLPLLDNLEAMPLDQPEGQIDFAKQRLGALPAGVTHFILHPAADTPELRAICPDWPSRVANYQTFMSQEVKDFIKEAGIQVIGYRDLKGLIAGD
ncbi:MAG: polysaccharide deacetylase family protein [Anaerolineales bacterium]|nr:polysaccharide deacetylase family protein [Anaerolineales bacterium]